MELDAVAHGNHDFGAQVVVEDVMNGLAGAAEDGAGHQENETACAAPDASRVKVTVSSTAAEAEDSVAESWLELGGNHAFGFDDELAVLDVEAEGVSGSAEIGVFAGKGVEMAADAGACAADATARRRAMQKPAGERQREAKIGRDAELEQNRQ